METRRRVHLEMWRSDRAPRPVATKERTNEMPTLLDDPCGRTMEPMVVTRGEIDDAEEEGVSGPSIDSRAASTFHG